MASAGDLKGFVGKDETAVRQVARKQSGVPTPQLSTHDPEICLICRDYFTTADSRSNASAPTATLLARCLHILEYNCDDHTDSLSFQKACNDYERWHTCGLLEQVSVCFFSAFVEY